MFTAFEELKRKRGTPFANIIVNIILAPKCLLLFHCNIRIIPCQYPFLKFLSISQKKHNFKNAHIMRKNHDFLYLVYEGLFIFIHLLKHKTIFFMTSQIDFLDILKLLLFNKKNRANRLIAGFFKNYAFIC